MHSNDIKPLMSTLPGSKNITNNQNRIPTVDKSIKKEFNLLPLVPDAKTKEPALIKLNAVKVLPHSNLNGTNIHNHSSLEKDLIKLTGKVRLFIGNINNDMTEEELKSLFKNYGSISEAFVSNRGFGFIKLESKFMADKAKHDLDGTTYKNKMIRVRIATTGTALKVLNLSPHVTNEILVKAFSNFGPLDSAVVVADERGKSVCEGIVEFSRKNQAQIALQKINEGVFLLTNSLKPVVVEPYETKDYEEGVAEKTVTKTAAYLKEIEQEPKFAQPGTFEYDYGNKWKALYQQEKIQRELLEKKILEDREALENDMESTLHEHQTMLMRQDLMRRQEELQRMEEARFHFMKSKEEHERKNDRRGDMNMFQQPYNTFQQPFGGQGQFQMPGNNSDMAKGDNKNPRGNLFPIDGFNMHKLQAQQQSQNKQQHNNASSGSAPSNVDGSGGGGGNPNLKNVMAGPPSNATKQQQAPPFPNPNMNNSQQLQQHHHGGARMGMPPLRGSFGPGGSPMRHMLGSGGPGNPPMPRPLMQGNPAGPYPPFGPPGAGPPPPRMMMFMGGGNGGGEDFNNDNNKRARRF